MENINIRVRGRDPKINEHYNGWNEHYNVDIDKASLDLIADEFFEILYTHFAERRKNLKRMDWSMYNTECHQFMISCSSYDKLIEEFEKQHPGIDFRMFDSYQTGLCISEFIFKEYNIVRRLRELIKKG